MKIKIETTLILTKNDIACVKLQMEDIGNEGETLRDFVKSNAASYADYFVQQTVSNYGDYTE